MLILKRLAAGTWRRDDGLRPRRWRASRWQLPLYLVSGALWWGCVDNPYIIARLQRGSDAATEDLDDAGAPGETLPLDPCTELSGALLCSSFEREDFSDWSSTVVTDGAILNQNRERVVSGNGALFASSMGREQTAVVAQELTPVMSGALHLRAWIYIPAGFETNTINLFFLGLDPYPVGDPAVPFIGMDFNLEGDALQVYSPQNAPDRVTGQATVPRDRWFCLTAEVRVAEQDGAVSVAIDGTTALSADPFVTSYEGGIILFRAGIDWTSVQDGPFAVFMDDVVLSRAPVTCD